MTQTAAEPIGETTTARRTLTLLGRIALGGALLIGAALIVADPVTYRSWEVTSAVPFVGAVTSGSVLHVPGRDVFVVGADTDQFWTFRVTAECTSAILIIPLLAVSGLLLLLGRRFTVRRVGRAVLVTASIVIGINIVRVAGIAWASMAWDRAGYAASHTFVGSGFSFVGFLIAITLGARSLLSDGRERERP